MSEPKAVLTPSELSEAPHRLADLVAYEPKSVVSRTLVKKPAGTVTLFAFDQGEGLSEHTAPFDALVTVLDGEADLLIAGRPHRTRAGEVLLFPANVPHAVQAVERFKMLLVMIRWSEPEVVKIG